MRIAEEPFVTRDSVLSMLRPGELTSERPFRTLRAHGAASPGFAVTMRSPGGHILGRLQLYSALNADAARAFRHQDTDLAQAFARRAEQLEHSPPARRVQQAVAAVAGHISLPPSMVDVPVGLRRYLELRGRSTWTAHDTAGMAREWLANSEAWLTGSDERDELVDAVVQLDCAACEARGDLVADRPSSVSTFFGVVRRMDAVAAEVEGESETLLVPREDLERQGLAVIDQPVALLREALPGRGSYLLPMAAVRLEEPEHDLAESSWDIGETPGLVPVAELAAADAAWLHRELAREPRAVPVAPLRLA